MMVEVVVVMQVVMVEVEEMIVAASVLKVARSFTF